jgi:hypothetical protein
MRKKLITNEEKVAKQLTTMLSDIRIDLDLVGYYLVQLSPNVIYNRLMVVADSAEEAKENQHNDHQYRLF